MIVDSFSCVLWVNKMRTNQRSGIEKETRYVKKNIDVRQSKFIDIDYWKRI